MKMQRMCLVAMLAMAPMQSGCERIEETWQKYQMLKKIFEPLGTTTIVWDEEVKLHDGRVIVVKRREATGGGGFPLTAMNSRGLTLYYEFCYPPMGLYWKSKGDPRYQPEILDIVGGKAYVMVPIAKFEACMFHDYPATNAIYYVWEGGAWKKITYEGFPKEIRRTNLLQNPWARKPEDDARGLVTTAQKENKFDRGIYWDMEQTKGRIQNETDYPNRRGCESYRGGRYQTTATPEVFLPPSPDLCQLPEQGGNTP